MSSQNPQELLKKKRPREDNSKETDPKPKRKCFQRKIKFGKKSKHYSKKVIKPQPIKKSLINQNLAQNYTNQLSNNETLFQEDDNEVKKEENSLGQLTRNFINYVKTTGKKSININDLVIKLAVKKRRIYDITNVLQGIGYIQKYGKNEIIWTKNIKKVNKSKKKPNIEKIDNSNSIQKLEQERDKIESKINMFRKEFNSIAKRSDFPNYSYVTIDDLKELSKNNNTDLLVIKATKGTTMNSINKNDSKLAHAQVKRMMEKGEMDKNESLLNILNKKNQLSICSKDDNSLIIKHIKNGELINNNFNNESKIEKNIEPLKNINNFNNINIPKETVFNKTELNKQFIFPNNKEDKKKYLVKNESKNIGILVTNSQLNPYNNNLNNNNKVINCINNNNSTFSKSRNENFYFVQ